MDSLFFTMQNHWSSLIRSKINKRWETCISFSVFLRDGGGLFWGILDKNNELSYFELKVLLTPVTLDAGKNEESLHFIFWPGYNTDKTGAKICLLPFTVTKGKLFITVTINSCTASADSHSSYAYAWALNIYFAANLDLTTKESCADLV